MIVIRKVTLILGTICFLLRLDEKKNGNVFISAACNEQAIDNIDKPSTAATLWWVEWIVRRILYCRQNSIVLILAFAEYGAQVPASSCNYDNEIDRNDSDNNNIGYFKLASYMDQMTDVWSCSRSWKYTELFPLAWKTQMRLSIKA